MLMVPLVVLQVVFFVGLFFALRFFLTRHATQATGHIEALRQEAVTQQEALKKQMEEAERHYQERIAKAEEEAQQLHAKSVQEIEAQRRQVLEQARQEADRIVNQAVQARGALQNELAQSAETRAVDRACQLLQSILPSEFREVTHQRWMDALLKNGLIPKEGLDVKEDLTEVKVSSAFPLTDEQRERITERLKNALGFQVLLQEVVDPSMVAGVTVTLGHLVLDGSLGSKIKEAARDAQDHPNQ